MARHADILTCIETRISMLSMTYSKYMDLNLCCFIPGRVLDEIFRILRLISKTNKPLRPHEVLQELRDISSMAIEHFDEKIAVTFKKGFENSSNICTSLDGNKLIVNCYSGNNFDSSITTASSFRASNCCHSTRQKVNSLYSNNRTLTSSLPFVYNNVNFSPSASGFSENDSNVNTQFRGCIEKRARMFHLKKIEVEYKKEIMKVRIHFEMFFVKIF